MARVRGAAVLADRGTRGIAPVEPVVTVGTQAPERPEPEGGEVASMWRDVISDARRRDVAGLQSEPAERLDHELMCSAALPGCGTVPAMDLRTVRHAWLCPWGFCLG